mmetsp:Transcript_20149/g.57169  ORF Transcript_20149/g.57169 Transcript_20149/m.57169 type:complete len:280 (+) Transcript_20149:520-1359(+)
MMLDLLLLMRLHLLSISQCRPEPLRYVLNGSVVVDGGANDVLHFFHETVQRFFAGLDDAGLSRGSVHGRMSLRFGQHNVGAFGWIGERHLAGPHAGAQDVVHGIAEDGAGTVRRHALGTGDAELQTCTVIAVDGQQGGCRLAGLLVELEALHVLALIAQGLAIADDLGETILDVLVDEFVMTRGPAAAGRIGRVRNDGGTGLEVAAAHVGNLLPEILDFLLPTRRLKRGTLHVRGLDDVLEELLHVGKGVDDGLSHDVVSSVVVFHELFGDGQQTVLVS